MLDDVEDLRALDAKKIEEIIQIFHKSFPVAINNPKYRSAFQLALLLDMAQNMRDIKKCFLTVLEALDKPKTD